MIGDQLLSGTRDAVEVSPELKLDQVAVELPADVAELLAWRTHLDPHDPSAIAAA